MNSLNLNMVSSYIGDTITQFYDQSTIGLQELKFDELLICNPYYLCQAKNTVTAGGLVSGLLEAFLFSYEEKLFTNFLKGLAILIAEMTYKGHKSSAAGVDLEFINNNVHYIISVKSGPSWGNSSQQGKLEQDLKNAVTRVKQSKRGANVQPVLGICYGKTKTKYVRGYMKVVGQNFWYLISENPHLYTDIIEPIGYRAKEHNESFLLEKGKVINRFTKQFIDSFCDESGAVNWAKLVESNSGNFDLDQFMP